MKKKEVTITIILIIITILTIITIQKTTKNEEETTKNNIPECTLDSDCIPATCCHANSCVAKEKAPLCEGILCSQECAPGSMDCGAGSCGCIQGICVANIGEP